MKRLLFPKKFLFVVFFWVAIQSKVPITRVFEISSFSALLTFYFLVNRLVLFDREIVLFLLNLGPVM